MKYNISDYKIKVIVDELGEEYKDLLIERVLADMNELDVDLINPSDLVKLDVTTKYTLQQDRKNQRFNRMSTVTFLMGILYALMGVLYMWWIGYSIRNNPTMMVGFLLVFIGLLVSLCSLIFKYSLKMRPRYYKNHKYIVSPYEIVNKWKEIEALINQLTPEKDSLSLTSMIANLKESRIISDQDQEFINQLLHIRNKAVHSRDIEDSISQTELRSILVRADEVIVKMRKLI